MSESFGVPNGDMEGREDDVMEDPVCCEDGDPFDDGTPGVVRGQEAIPHEISSNDSHSFPVDGDGGDDDISVTDSLGPPPVQDDIVYDSHDEPELSGPLHDIDNIVSVTGGDEYPSANLDDDDDVFPLLDDTFNPDGLTNPIQDEPDIPDSFIELSDEEVWSGTVRRRGECDEDSVDEPDRIKRRRLLDEDCEWEDVDLECS